MEIPFRKIIHYQDIWFSAVFLVESEYVINIKVYQIIGLGHGGKPEIFLYEGNNNQWVESIDSACIYLHGSIKWDGCGNFHFDEQDNVMLHFCGRQDAESIGVLFKRLYIQAKEMLVQLGHCNFD